MRNTLFATGAVAALILTGAVGWAASSTHGRVEAPKVVQIDTFQMTTNSKDLPVQTYEDRSFVF